MSLDQLLASVLPPDVVNTIIKPQLGVEAKMDLEAYIPMEAILEIASALSLDDAITFQLRVISRFPPAFWMDRIRKMYRDMYLDIQSIQRDFKRIYNDRIALNKAIRQYYNVNFETLNRDKVELLLMAGLYEDPTILHLISFPKATILYLQLRGNDLQDLFDVELNLLLDNLTHPVNVSVLYFVLKHGVAITGKSLITTFDQVDNPMFIRILDTAAVMCPIYVDEATLNTDIRGYTLFSLIMEMAPQMALNIMRDPNLDFTQVIMPRNRAYIDDVVLDRLFELRPDLLSTM